MQSNECQEIDSLIGNEGDAYWWMAQRLEAALKGDSAPAPNLEGTAPEAGPGRTTSKTDTLSPAPVAQLTAVSQVMTEPEFFRMVHEYAAKAISRVAYDHDEDPVFLFKPEARRPLVAIFEKLKRYREREPLVRAVFTTVVGNADSYYNTEFAPAAIEAMRESLKTFPAAEAAEDESA